MSFLSFGIISDVQFAFAKDRVNLPGKKSRHYQNSKSLLKEAVSHWNNERDNRFVIQLGDIIDGVNKGINSSHLALEAVLEEFDKVDVDVKHVLGNHELYNFSRCELLPLLARKVSQSSQHRAFKTGGRHQTMQDFPSPPDAFYFTFIVKGHPDYRFIVLDTFDVSVLGRNTATNEYKNAYNILRKHNANEDLEDSTGIIGIARRYTSDNGALGKEQMEWLDTVLYHADGCNQKVVLFSHVPLHPFSEGDTDILWNYDEVMDLLWSHPSVKVQAQLLATERNYCDFVVWTNKSMVIEQIYPDKKFLDDSIPKAKAFFERGILPEMAVKFYSRPPKPEHLSYPLTITVTVVMESMGKWLGVTTSSVHTNGFTYHV